MCGVVWMVLVVGVVGFWMVLAIAPCLQTSRVAAALLSAKAATPATPATENEQTTTQKVSQPSSIMMMEA